MHLLLLLLLLKIQEYSVPRGGIILGCAETMTAYEFILCRYGSKKSDRLLSSFYQSLYIFNLHSSSKNSLSCARIKSNHFIMTGYVNSQVVSQVVQCVGNKAILIFSDTSYLFLSVFKIVQICMLTYRTLNIQAGECPYT